MVQIGWLCDMDIVKAITLFGAAKNTESRRNLLVTGLGNGEQPIDIMRARALYASKFLPLEYQRVDYLQCTGRDSCIDTGVNGDDNTLAFEFTYMPLASQAYFGHFGNYSNESRKCWRVIQNSATYPRFLLFSANAKRAGASGTIAPVPSDAESVIGRKIKIRLSYGRMETECDGYTASATTDTDDYEASPNNICIGSIVSWATGTGPDARFYGDFKIWQGGALIRDYVPCYRISDDKAGYYDEVNRTFNPSIGAAEFIAGNE